MSENKPVALVVDDERVIADTLAHILNQAGFNAHAAYDGPQAVSRARDLSPHLVVCDVVLNLTDPQAMNGIDAAIEIRKLLPESKILLFSGQAAAADLLETARSQGHDFEILAKPVHPQDLLAKLRGR